MRGRVCSGAMLAEAAGDEAGATVAVAAGGLGPRRFFRASSNLRCFSVFSASDVVGGEDSVGGADAETDGAADGAIDGEGLKRGGDGRTLMVGDADTTGDGVAAGAVDAAGVGEVAGAAVALDSTDAEGEGRVLTVADGEAAGEAEAVASAGGVGLAVVAVGLVAAVVALGVALGAAVAAGLAAGVSAVVVSCGFTNVFGGAFGGTVASAFILVRVRSAAERSVMAVQPLSITTSETRSLTVRGRWKPGMLPKTEIVISSSSPRTVAKGLSPLISFWRCNR